MRYELVLFFALASAAGCDGLPRRSDVNGNMDNERLDSLIRVVSGEPRGELGYWSFEVEKRELVVITDETADRMRIMTPVVEESALSAEDLRVLLTANFDRALDARYAVGRGYLWSVFLHPLTTLTDAQFLDGVGQVVRLAQNYGTSYTSSDLVFQGGQN